MMDENDSLPAERLAFGVSRELALHRAGLIRNLEYTISLYLGKGKKELSVDGEVEIRFDLREAPLAPLLLDFRDLDKKGSPIEGALIGAPQINGRVVAPLRQVNGHILLHPTDLKAGQNRVRLGFRTRMAAAGRPLLRYQDREDGNVYVYSLLVPMDASLLFPCFDQPDLKARFSLIIDAPEEWSVIANGARLGATEGDPPSRHRFAETEPISSYLFAFAAGPFVALGEGDRPLPLRLHVRRSQAERARREWPTLRELTVGGMAYLTHYFGHRFPFAKYDQVLLPGFPYGGMEHAGATFLREDAILFRSAPTRGDLLNRAALVLHELVHQWFGDLVTMRWFDDLWLKEGFANYMAYRAMAELQPLGLPAEQIWKRFYLTHKPAAYTIDGSPGTTPIFQQIDNLKDAKSAYGAIVYQKAPGLLRALCYRLGEDPFRQGVRQFVERYAYANASWQDLIESFEAASGEPLRDWARAWIRERGMPRIEVDWRCDEGTLAEVTVRQSDVQGEGRRWPIETQLLIVTSDGARHRHRVRLTEEQVVWKDARRPPCPRFLFANEGDYGYGLFLLDAKSRAAVTADLLTIEDPFLRTLLWGALWEAVREAEMAPEEFLQLVLRATPHETDEDLLESLIERVGRTWQRYLSPLQQTRWLNRIEAQWAAGMMDAPTLNGRILYFRSFRSLTRSSAGRERLKALLGGRQTPPEIEIRPFDRWRLLAGLLAHGDPDAERLLAEEIRRDRSDDAAKQAYLIGAARPDPATKRRYFADYLGETASIPEDWIEGSLPFFHLPHQADLTLPYLERGLKALPRLKRERKIFFVLAWLNHFLGGQTGEEARQIVEQFLERETLDRDLTLKIREVSDELVRTTRIRKRFAAEESRAPRRQA